MIHQTTIKNIGKMVLPDPFVGDFKLNVFPILHTGDFIHLPHGYEMWEKSLNELMKQVPLVDGCNLHYITIDSKFFSTAEFLRREGVHADGNFCVDPNFTFATWGGSTWAGADIEEEKRKTWGGTEVERTTWGGVKPKRTTWGGTDLVELNEEGVSYVEKDGKRYKVIRNWAVPYKLDIPIGDYISSEKGGIFCISSAVGCQAWSGEFYGEVGSEGCYDLMKDQLTDDRKTVFKENEIYFMTSNTPHESLLIDKGVRRTFMRLTLNHEYPNKVLPCMINQLVNA